MATSSDRRLWPAGSVLLLVGAMLLALCSTGEAQTSARVYKIGRLSSGSLSDPLSVAAYKAFQQGLTELGWVEGTNVTVENRWVNDKLQNARTAASELVRLQVDVIVAVGSPLVNAAKQATKTIPIVMSGSGADPVTAGFVASLQRPGANITGLSMLSTDLSGKRLELLKELTPNLERVAVLRNPDFPAVAVQSQQTEASAKALGVRLQVWDVKNIEEIKGAFTTMRKAGSGGLLVFSDPVLLERNRSGLIALTVKHRIPTIFPWRNYVEEGGLMSYSASLMDMHYRAATYVDKILKGAKAADLPVEQPTKFELVINLKTAKQIGLAIPPNVLARADRVIR